MHPNIMPHTEVIWHSPVPSSSLPTLLIVWLGELIKNQTTPPSVQCPPRS